MILYWVLVCRDPRIGRGGAPPESGAKAGTRRRLTANHMSESLMPMPLYKALSPRFPPPPDLLPFGMAGRF